MHKIFEREAAKIKVPIIPRIPLGKHGHTGDNLISNGRTASSASEKKPEVSQEFVRVKNRHSLTSFKQM